MDYRRIESKEELAALVHDDVMSQTDRIVAIGLPGGRSAAAIIAGLLACPEKTQQNLRLYLVDERLEGEKNIDTLRTAGLDRLERNGTKIAIPDPKRGLVVEKPLDFLYLGVGEDGHVASLFPSQNTTETEPIAIIDDSPKPPARRVTVTYRWFRTAAEQAKVRLLLLGEGKREALARLLAGSERATTLPCRFFIDEGFDTTVITDLRDIGPGHEGATS